MGVIGTTLKATSRRAAWPLVQRNSTLEEMMPAKILSACTLCALLFFFSHQLKAQEIVHALCGTVSSINGANKTITLFEDGGSRGTFKEMSSSSTRIAFDKKLSGQVISAKDFQKQGDYVVLFYFGLEDNRTAVAVESLGSGPFSSMTGEVTKWNGRDRTVSVRDKDGTVRSFKVDAKTVAETYQGAIDGSKFDAANGAQVRVVSSTKDGAATVLFIREK
jgi:hypothetical protein